MSHYVLVDNVYNDAYDISSTQAVPYNYPKNKDEYIDSWSLRSLSERDEDDERHSPPKELWLIVTGRKKIKFDAQMSHNLLLLRKDIFDQLIPLLKDEVIYMKANVVTSKINSLSDDLYYAVFCKKVLNIIDMDKSILKQNKFGDIDQIDQFIIDKTKKLPNIFYEENIYPPENMIISQKIKDKFEALNIKNLKFFELENLDLAYLSKF